MKKNENFRSIIEFTGLVIGCIFIAIGINMFFAPYTIAPGGLSGLALVLNKTLGVPTSAVMLGIGLPILVCSYKILGKKDFIKTFMGMMILSLFIELTSPMTQIIATKDILLSAITGAILVGVGLGITFVVDGSTGGTDLIALLLHRLNPRISIGKYLIIIDGIVVVSAGIVDRNLETGLYSAIALYVITKVVDAIVEGFDYSKAFMIITDKEEILRDTIVHDMKRGVTLLDARGGYTNKEKSMLLVVVKRHQEVHLKKLVKQKDPQAFIIVSDVHEVFGEGFSEVAKA